MPSPSTERVRIEFFKELYECVVSDEGDGKLSETCVALIEKHPDLVSSSSSSSLDANANAKCPPSGFQIEERRFVRDGFTTRYKTITRWCGLTATECMCEEVQQDDCGGAHVARDLLLQLIEAGAPVTDKCYNLGAKTTDGITNIYIVEALLAGGYVPLLQRQRQRQQSDGESERTYFFLDGMVESVGNGDWDFDDEDDLEALACDELHGILKILNKQVKVGDPCSFGQYSPTVVHNVKTKLPKLKPSVSSGGEMSWSKCGGVATHSPDGPFAAVQETWLRLNGLSSTSNVEESEDDRDSDSDDSDSDDQEEDEEVEGVELEEADVKKSDRCESTVEEKEDDDAVQEEDQEDVGSGSSSDEEEDHDHDDSDYDDEKKKQKVVVREVARRGSNNSSDRDRGSGKGGSNAIGNVGHKRKRNSEDEGEGEEETRSSHNDEGNDDDGKKQSDLAGSGGHIQHGTTTTTSSSKNSSDPTNANNDNDSGTATDATATNDNHDNLGRNEIDGNTTTTNNNITNNNNHNHNSSNKDEDENVDKTADAITNSTASDNTDSANSNQNDANTSNSSCSKNNIDNNTTDFYGNGGFFPAGCAVNFPKNEHWNSAMLAYDVMTTDVTACVKHNNGTVERMPRQDIEIVPIDSGRPSRRRGRKY